MIVCSCDDPDATFMALHNYNEMNFANRLCFKSFVVAHNYLVNYPLFIYCSLAHGGSCNKVFRLYLSSTILFQAVYIQYISLNKIIYIQHIIVKYYLILCF